MCAALECLSPLCRQVHPPSFIPRPLCQHDCASSEQGPHTRVAERGDKWTLDELHALPAQLTNVIAKSCDKAISEKKDN